MKLTKLFQVSSIFFIYASQYVLAQTPQFEWAKQFSGTDNEEGSAIVADNIGNIYTIGEFRGTVDFDPGLSTVNLTSSGGADVFLQKLDPAGNLIWLKQIEGDENVTSEAIALAPSGHIYTTGNFFGTADFDPGPDSATLTSEGGTDIYIQKLDTNGDFVWAKRIGGTSPVGSNGIAVDLAENIYIAGRFTGETDFDPGTEIFNMTSAGNADIFILKIDSEGNFLWAKQMGGIGFDAALSLALDEIGGIVTTGIFSETVDFNPGVGTLEFTSNGLIDVYIQKLDDDGDLIWALQFGGEGEDYGTALSIDDFGNIYTTGSFAGTVDFNPATETFNLMSGGASDMYIQKLNSSGELIWVKNFGGPMNARGLDLALDTYGNIYTTGRFVESINFDPGTDTAVLVSAGLGDGFIHKLDSNGNFIWAERMGSDLYEQGQSIFVDDFGNILVTGYFQGVSNFDLNENVLISAGGIDCYVLKYSQEGFTTINSLRIESIPELIVYPNPSSGNFYLECDELLVNAVLTISDSRGRLISNMKIQNAAEVHIELQGKPGLYFLTISSSEWQKTIRLLKQ